MWSFPFHIEDAVLPDWQELKRAFSWVADMEGVEQDPIFHAEGDVETHVRMVVKELLGSDEYKVLPQQERNILFATAMLHDVEKRSTTERVFKEGRWKVTSMGHAKKGESTSRSILYRDVVTPFHIREMICKLVRHHGIPIRLFDRDDQRMEAMKTSLDCNNHLLSVFARADMRGRTAHDVDERLYEIDLFAEYCRDLSCYEEKGKFASDLTRFKFFNHTDPVWPQQETFDDTKLNAYIMVGVPASGKDRYIEQHLSGLPTVSMDDIRRTHHLKRNTDKDKGQVIQLAKEQARVHLRAGEDFVWNATNVNKSTREELVNLFMPYKPKIHMVYVERPYKQLLKGNLDREHPVKIASLERYIDKLDVPSLMEAHTVTYHIEEP